MSALHRSIVGNKLLSMLPLSNYEQVTVEPDDVILPWGTLLREIGQPIDRVWKSLPMMLRVGRSKNIDV